MISVFSLLVCALGAGSARFFATLKKELVYYYRTYTMTKSQVKSLVFWYIEVYYNRMRLHSSIGYMPPAKKREEYYKTRNAA